MKRIRKMLLILAVMLMTALGSGMTASAGVQIPAIVPGEPITQVKTLRWKATLGKNVKTKYGRFKRGTSVIVTRTGNRCIILLKGHRYRISRRYLEFTKALVTSQTEGDYNTSTKIQFANKKRRKSKTKYFIWVSLDKQRVNVYQGKSKNWRLIRVMKCSTAKGAGTPTGYYRIGFKKREFEYLSNYMEFAGSGFHMWPSVYPNAKQTLGNDVASHGCVRLYWGDSNWMYNHIRTGTRVLIY